MGRSSLDHTNQISFGGSATLKYGPQVGIIGHFFSAAPADLTLDPAGTSGSEIGAIYQSDVNGDGFNDLVITDPGPTGGQAPMVAVLLQDATHPHHRGDLILGQSYPLAAQIGDTFSHISSVIGSSSAADTLSGVDNASVFNVWTVTGTNTGRITYNSPTAAAASVAAGTVTAIRTQALCHGRLKV